MASITCAVKSSPSSSSPPPSYSWPSNLSPPLSFCQSADKIDGKIRSQHITSNLERKSMTKKINKTCVFSRTLQVNSPCLHTPTKQVSQFPISTTRLCQFQTHLPPLFATLNTPKGFGPSPKKSKKNKKNKKSRKKFDEEDEEEVEEEEEEEIDRGEGVIPEIVTNRMISRMGFTVGIPLLTGMMFFPLFYYLKVGLKIDVPNWVPFIVSFIFFGSALAGVSYGIVSSSWDPMREGSLLGWTEAQKNWPVFWQSFRNGGRSGKN